MSDDAPRIVEHLDALSHEGLDFVGALVASGIVNVQITDPPFSAHVHASATSTGTGGRGPVGRDFGFEAITPELRALIATVAAAIPRWTIVHSDYEGAPAWWEDMAAESVEWIRLVPWVRWSQPQITGDRPGSQSEAVLHFHAQNVGPRGGVQPRAKRWNGPGGLMQYGARCLRSANKHPTEKPIDLMLDLVAFFSDPGEVIFDPCAGWGTTGAAAGLLGRGCVLLERDAAHARRAKARAGRLDLLPRDIERAREWAQRTHADARAELEGEASENVQRRARSRMADARRVADALGGVEL